MKDSKTGKSGKVKELQDIIYNIKWKTNFILSNQCINY